MAVTIDGLVADAAESRHGVRLIPRARQLTEQELAAKPPEYPLLVEATVATLGLAAELLPQLLPRHRGQVAAAALRQVVHRLLDEQLLDLHWQHRLVTRLAADGEARQRRSLLAMLRDGEDPHERYVEAAEGEAERIRELLLQPRTIEGALDEMVRDGFLVWFDGAYGLPGAELTEPGPFHGEVLREAVLGHLEEVRRWELPAPTPDRLLALAREHSRILTGASVEQNSMLRMEVRQRLERRLEQLSHPADTRTECLQRWLLEAHDLPRNTQGGLDAYRAADRVEPLVTAPFNVVEVLEAMTEEVLLRPLPGASEPTFVDPLLPLPTPAPAAAQPAPAAFDLAPATVVTAPAFDAEGIKARLRLLRDLLTDELITPDDYERRKTHLLEQI